MTTHEILSIIRNPWGWSEDEVRAARLAAADLIEQQAKDVETLNSVSKAMARTGMQIRNDLAEAKLKNIEQAKEIEALRTGDTCGRSCEGQAYRIELRQALARIDELERLNLTFAQNEQQVEALRGFAQDIMASWPESGIDGGDLQDIAEKHGLLRLETRTEPCGENCACAEYGDFPVTCYRKTKLLTGQ